MSEEDKVFTSAIKRNNAVKNNLYDLIPKEDDLKVFCSGIERGEIVRNNLYELIEVGPVTPLKPQHETDENIDFNYDKEKCYVSKRYSKFTSVKTVNSIRSEFEKDIYEHLVSDLEKQDSFLLKKIRYGYSGDEKTINIAKKIMDSGRPLYRSTLQMISTINPSKYNHPTQYVLFNGSYIRVSGSLGGNRKFVCNFDLGKKKKNKNHRFGGIQKNSDRKKLLIKSLSTKFKPGPLTKKSTLDESYQKFNVGAAEVVKLPNIGLNVQPCIGLAIEPTICDILSLLHKDNIRMTETWAEYSVSTLYSNDNSENKGITFALPYKNNQKCIMMRRDTENVKSIEIEKEYCTRASVEDTDKEVTDILDRILDSVEISLNQATMYTGEDDQSNDDTNLQPINTETVQNTKKNEKNKSYSLKELERLDVTVIRLANTTGHESNECFNECCLKGCVCASLNCESKFKDHCGRVGCMFECKCDFSKYKVVNCLGDAGVDGYLPGLYNLDTKINSKLAKEEKKFHQTIVVTDEKSIILKSHKRNLKTPKRYVEYFEGKEGPKRQSNLNKILTISLEKLPDTNIEPWCMVHNLYKCFCKGIFTERALDNIENLTIDHDKEQEKVKETNPKTHSTRVRPGVETPVKTSSSSISKLSSLDIALEAEPEATEFYGRHRKCARTVPFTGQKFDSSFYKETNRKIRSMEQNDQRLKDKCNRLASSSESESSSIDVQVIQNESLDSDNETEKSVASNNSEENNFLTPAKKSKLITWLNANYKHYKQMLAQGNNTIFLKAPTPGKLALYPWEVIRDRYKFKKNFFLVTKDLPYRLFMAVHKDHPFFKNCIPIDQIPFMELRKYPISVRNLIDGACYVSDNFYILGGLALCWEIIGSVTKVNDRISSPGATEDKEMNFSFNDEINTEEKFQPVKEQKSDVEMSIDLMQKRSSAVSKWFVMTIENDFSEIQFHNKGFFVKFDIILRAIKVSRSTKKTVRLSSTKSNETDSPQFGIYAVPEMNKHCVFIGPYEIHEALGFGIIPKSSHNIKNKTTGYWITTEKDDNYKVIDDPLSFFKSNVTSKKVPHVSNRLDDKSKENSSLTHIEEEIKIENDELQSSIEQIKEEHVKSDVDETPTKKPKIVRSVKVIKPITIKKSQSLLSFNKFRNTISFVNNKILQDNNLPIPIIKETFSLANTDKASLFGDVPKATTSKPIAEIAPQVKQSSTNIQTENEDQTLRRPIKPEGGMFILKPEEINQRHLGHRVDVKVNNEIPPDDPMHTDIEDFLATSTIVMGTDVLEISDEEQELPPPLEPSEPEYEQVWIEPVAIQNLGWIPGRRNSENEISFEFPGFKYTAFYPQVDALHKILQVLSRKVYVPKLFPVKWRVVDSPDKLITKKKMETSDLGSDYVLTKSGLKHKADLVSMRTKLLSLKTQIVTEK